MLTDASQLFGETLQRNLWVGITLALIVFVTTFLVGVKLQRSIKRPLSAFKDYIDQVEQGDLTQSLVLDSGDEFEETAGQINRLTKRLCHVMQDIGQQSKDAQDTADYVVSASADLSAVLSEQSSEVGGINGFMATLRQSSEQVSERVGNTHDRIDEVSGLAAQARQATQSSSETVDELLRLLARTIENVEQLAQDINEIHSMTDMISSVADQTNLLALNAAIEAARAGDHGRGFAVVADEVRSLASSTQNTTEVIRGHIEKIVRQSELSKKDVDACSTIAKQSHQQFVELGLVMKKIDVAAEEVTAFTAEVNAVTHQQAGYLTNCEHSLQNINRLANLNDVTFKNISEIMIRLVDLTNTLKKDSDYFKYNCDL
jgi:methyl-accepting chemotaxis protein